MNESSIVGWLQSKLCISDIDCTLFIRHAKEYGRIVICNICEDYPNGIVLVYHNNMDEFEILV